MILCGTASRSFIEALIQYLLLCAERNVAHLQCHESTALSAGGMGKAHPALYVVAGGGSGDSAQGWLERAANSRFLSPFHRDEG